MQQFLNRIQSVLEYEDWSSPQFHGNSAGKIGTTGFILGIVGGLHMSIAAILITFLCYNPNYESNIVYPIAQVRLLLLILSFWRKMNPDVLFLITLKNYTVVLLYESSLSVSLRGIFCYCCSPT